MKNYIYLMALLCALTSAKAQDKTFNLKGNLSKVDLPMKVYLYYRDGDQKKADSTVAQKGKFNFKGTIAHATEASIYTHFLDPEAAKKAGLTSYGIQLMLEDGTSSIEGDWLKNATVKGGSAQADLMAYRQQLDAAGDSVYHIWKSQLGTLPEDSAASFKRLLYARNKVLGNVVQAFVETHPASEMSFSILEQNTLIITEPDRVLAMLASLRPEFGSTARFKEIQGKVELAKRLSIGQPAINFSQTDDTGKIVSLSDVKGKYVLVDFWASWCGPCRAEYPHLKQAYAKYKDKNFEIIGISLDSKKNLWLNAIKDNNFEWIQLADLKGSDNEVAKAYGITAIPQNFLIDPQGKIIAKDLRGTQLEEHLSKFL